MYIKRKEDEELILLSGEPSEAAGRRGSRGLLLGSGHLLEDILNLSGIELGSVARAGVGGLTAGAVGASADVRESNHCEVGFEFGELKVGCGCWYTGCWCWCLYYWSEERK